MPIQNIIFDLGGVLIDWNPRYLYRKLLPNEAEIEQFLTEVCPYSWNLYQDEGRSLREATDERLALFPEHAALIEAYYGRWEEMLGGAIEGTVAIMEELRAEGFPLYALTNWSAETFPIAKRHFSFLHQFKGTVMSGEERVRKPNPRLYEILFERYSLDPSTCLFIDDVPANIEAGERLGMRGILFESPEQCRKDLAFLLG
jgi:2-haloacid dehalogenase